LLALLALPWCLAVEQPRPPLVVPLAVGLVNALLVATTGYRRRAFASTNFDYGGIATITLLVLAGHRGLDVRELGWRRPSWRWALGAVPLTLLALAVAGALAGIAQTLLPHVQNQQCITVREQYGHSILLALPVVCVAAPVVEETVFRGVLYRWLRGVLPLATAMLASGAVFALAHATTLLFLPLLGLGILLAWIYERSGSLWPGVLVHALFNLAGIVDILTAPRC
jgi:membrane protease YdiL (CAAX protease family)